MGKRQDQPPCRKCKTPNPISNEYCRKCGAVLTVSTAEVRAQPKPVLPDRKGIRWHWVGMGSLVILGLAVVLQLILLAAAWMVIDSPTRIYGTGSSTDNFIGFSMMAGILFLLSFVFGGIAITWLSKRHSILEPIIASFFVLLLLACAGWSVTEDAPFLAALAALPLAILAGLGGKLGELLAGGGNRQ